MPFWFMKEIFLTYLGIAILFFLGLYGLKKGYYLGSISLISFSILGFILAKKNLSKRKHGLSLEKKAYKYLKKQLPYKLEFRKRLRSGGDVDIYVKDLGIAIDVKAYRKIDKRIFTAQNLRSFERQKEVADKLIVWLPNAKGNVKHFDGFIVVRGWKNMVNYLSRY